MISVGAQTGFGKMNPKKSLSFERESLGVSIMLFWMGLQKYKGQKKNQQTGLWCPTTHLGIAEIVTE